MTLFKALKSGPTLIYRFTVMVQKIMVTIVRERKLGEGSERKL